MLVASDSQTCPVSVCDGIGRVGITMHPSMHEMRCAASNHAVRSIYKKSIMAVKRRHSLRQIHPNSRPKAKSINIVLLHDIMQCKCHFTCNTEEAMAYVEVDLCKGEHERTKSLETWEKKQRKFKKKHRTGGGQMTPNYPIRLCLMILVGVSFYTLCILFYFLRTHEALDLVGARGAGMELNMDLVCFAGVMRPILLHTPAFRIMLANGGLWVDEFDPKLNIWRALRLYWRVY